MKRRVLFVTRFMECGGVERNVLNLMDHFDDAHWDVRVGVLDGRGDFHRTARRQDRLSLPRWGPLERWLTRPGRLFPLKKLVVDVCYGFRLQWLLLRWRPDVLVTACLDSIIVAGFTFKLGATWVGWVGSDLHEHLSAGWRWRGLLRGLVRLVYRRPEWMVAASEGLRRALIEHWGLRADRVAAVHNPIDTSRVAELSEVPVETPERFLLGVGRFVDAKGFDLLLEAAARLDRRMPVVLLGSGEEQKRLEALARTLGIADRVAMPGVDPNPWRWMRRAALVVAPSRHEGFANVVAEAQACGAVLVVSDCRHGPREIVAAGESAEVVPSGDVPALADAIQRMLGDEERRRRFAVAGPEQAARFDVARICAQWRALLDRVVKR